MRYFVSAVVAAVLLVAPIANAAEPLLVYEGDGLRINVLTLSDDETTIGGEIIKGDSRWPFTGKSSTAGNVETVRGTFTVGKDSYTFTASHREGDKLLSFVTDGTTYQLKLKEPGGAPSPAPAPADPVRPAPPVIERTGTAKFTTAEFRDINMANVVAYTMLIPEGFEATGHVEWSTDKTPYPQTKIKVVARDKSQISFAPAATFGFTDMSDQAKADSARMGLQPIPAQGIMPPKDLAAWLVEYISQNNKQVANVKLVSDQRDAAAEKAMVDNAVKNPNGGPGKWEVHLIQYTYTLDGVPFTEEIKLSYAQLPPMLTQNVNSWMWMLFTNSQVRCPTAKWATMRPQLYASATSLQAVPKWFTQSQWLIMKSTKENFEIGMKEIAARAAEYDKIRDEDMKVWRKNNEISDKQQDERINRIYEVSNFAGPDGSVRKLPNGFKHYWSDGKGGFQMSNTNEPPGGAGSGWNPVEPMKQ